MHGTALPEELVLAHQLVGYTTAFVIAPLALLAFTEPQRHRGWAKYYLYLMIPLYLSGLYFTFPTMPTTVSPRIWRPSALSAGQKAFATLWLTTTSRGPVGPSW